MSPQLLTRHQQKPKRQRTRKDSNSKSQTPLQPLPSPAHHNTRTGETTESPSLRVSWPPHTHPSLCTHHLPRLNGFHAWRNGCWRAVHSGLKANWAPPPTVFVGLCCWSHTWRERRGGRGIKYREHYPSLNLSPFPSTVCPLSTDTCRRVKEWV